MYKAYTVMDNGIVMPGIRPDGFESVDADPGTIMALVDVEFVPVTGHQVSMGYSPETGLAFISPAKRPKARPEPGCIVDVSCLSWRPGNGRGRVLLDTSLDSSRVLLYLSPDSPRTLVAVGERNSFISTGSDGMPFLCTATRASALREAAMKGAGRIKARKGSGQARSAAAQAASTPPQGEA